MLFTKDGRICNQTPLAESNLKEEDQTHQEVSKVISRTSSPLPRNRRDSIMPHVPHTQDQIRNSLMPVLNDAALWESEIVPTRSPNEQQSIALPSVTTHSGTNSTISGSSTPTSRSSVSPRRRRDTQLSPNLITSINTTNLRQDSNSPVNRQPFENIVRPNVITSITTTSHRQDCTSPMSRQPFENIVRPSPTSDPPPQYRQPSSPVHRVRSPGLMPQSQSSSRPRSHSSPSESPFVDRSTHQKEGSGLWVQGALDMNSSDADAEQDTGDGSNNDSYFNTLLTPDHIISPILISSINLSDIIHLAIYII